MDDTSEDENVKNSKKAEQSSDEEEDGEDEDNRTCDPKSAGSALFIPKSDDVEDIPMEVAQNLCKFELSHLEGKSKVVRILDGDTIELLIYVRLSELSLEREKGRALGKKENKKKALKIAILTSHQNAGFFSLFSCRWSGVDAAEHFTINGIINKLLIEDYFNYLNNIIYIKIDKFDKYGRMMANLYSDNKYTDLINTKLIGVKIEEIPEIMKEKGIKYNKDILSKDDLKIIALPYSGDTKDERFKNLPKVSKDIINRKEHQYLLDKYRIV